MMMVHLQKLLLIVLTFGYLNTYHSFNPGRKSHKFEGPGLRYEIVVAISTGWIVSINRPFLFRSCLDLQIARSNLHFMVPCVEFYLADRGYKAPYTPDITKDDIPASEQNKMNWLMARHEQMNRRFKE